MKLRRYVASDMKEALEAVRAELGPDAVIIHSQERRPKGLARLWRKPRIEVLAAVEEDQGRRLARPMSAAPADDERLRQIERRLEAISETLRSSLPAAAAGAAVTRTDPAQASSGSSSSEPAAWKVSAATAARVANSGKLPAGLGQLRAQGVSEGLLAMLGDLSPAEREGPGLVASLKRLLPPCERLTSRGGQPDVIFFLGPTGVGKTTTLAKVAAELLLQQGRRVGLITVDTFRVAAVPQVEIYANLLQVDMRVAYSPDELKQAVASFAGYDFVLVDTPGRSPVDEDGLAELEQYVAAVPSARSVLLLDAGAHLENLRLAARGFRAQLRHGIIFTKLDETQVYGPLYTIAAEIGTPIYYLTIGQNVPQDIEPATADRLVALLTGSGPAPGSGLASEFVRLSGSEIARGLAGGSRW